ncbi:MAG: 6-pyruvoyl tetrahydropterin synthase family protein [Planctomycetes bacterium]|nr:6-pyruvoyl tetrahydropterin synthase family protein [Planctomycetota bacterium]
MERYRIRVSKDYLTFSSAHFITLEGSQCERLHGHNYRVAAELEGPLQEEGLIFDFTELKRMLRLITSELDHRLLVPTASRRIAVEEEGERIRLSMGGREWVVPRCDCVLLPLSSTTAELLARHIAGRLVEELEKKGAGFVETVRVQVEEAAGQVAEYETSRDG